MVLIYRVYSIYGVDYRVYMRLITGNIWVLFTEYRCVFFTEYIWDSRQWMLKDNKGAELEQWLYLPDYLTPPNSYKLIADFFQLLFVGLQWRVFRQELSSRGDEPDGGTNEDITPEVEAKSIIPVEDFTTKIT